MGAILSVIVGADVYGPEPMGRSRILVAGERVAAVGEDVAVDDRGLIEEIAFDGLVAVPGLVDAHVHFLGGGGGDGHDSRGPELQLTDFTVNGITTTLGPLGIDPVSRSLEGLLAKARALTEAGISAFVYTGGFRKPLLNLTGSPWRDAYLIPDVRGVKLAIGLDRAPVHSLAELADLSREIYWVERATGRRLVLHVHLGPLPDGHALIRELPGVLAQRDRLVVTHCNRSEAHIQTAIELAKQGVWTDMTCMISPERGMSGSVSASAGVLRLMESGAPAERITLSTDGNGSVPEGRPGSGWSPYRSHMDSLLAEMRVLIASGLPLASVLALATARPADSLGLDGKGHLRPGADADVLGLGEGLEVREVLARGRRMVMDGRAIVGGRYEGLSG